jgi:HSP20 family protein
MLVRAHSIPALFGDIDELFSTAFPVTHPYQRFNTVSGVTMKDTGESVDVTFDLPGIAKSDVKVTLHDGVLTVAAERKRPELRENEQWIRNEIRYGKFERSVNLPYPVAEEKISAVHENGLLRVTLPKAEEAKPKQIVIR